MGNLQQRAARSDAASWPMGGLEGAALGAAGEPGDVGASSGPGDHAEPSGADGSASLRAALAQCAHVFGRLATALLGVQETVEQGERVLRSIDCALLAHVERRVEEAVRAAEERLVVRLRERTGDTPVDLMPSNQQPYPSRQSSSSNSDTSS